MTLTVVAPDGVPEVRPGDDLAALVVAALAPVDGDVVVVTSKVVSKAEGRVVPGTDRLAAVAAPLFGIARWGGLEGTPGAGRAAVQVNVLPTIAAFLREAVGLTVRALLMIHPAKITLFL